jgi:hypothetical protein
MPWFCDQSRWPQLTDNSRFGDLQPSEDRFHGQPQIFVMFIVGQTPRLSLSTSLFQPFGFKLSACPLDSSLVRRQEGDLHMM